MRKLRDLLANGPVLETKVRRELMRDYEHGRALRAYRRQRLADRRLDHRKRSGVDRDGVAREPDLQTAADLGRRILANQRIDAIVRRGVAIRETGPDGLTYLRWAP